MTAFKKWLINKGVDTNESFPWLPYEARPGIIIEEVVVNAERAEVVTYYNVAVCIERYGRGGDVVFQDYR